MFQVDRLARKGVRIPAIAAAICGLGCIGLVMVSCTSAPTAFLVNGPTQTGNVPPTMKITEPTANLTRGQGESFLIKWTDADPDDNARISFSLINTTTNATIPLVQAIPEDDQVGPDAFTVLTQLVPIGTYNILGTIDDTHNPPVQVFAVTTDTASTRVIVTIVGQGQGQSTQPPIVVVTAPQFDLSVTQDDILTVVVQPVAVQPQPPAAPIAFDTEHDTTLYVLLDKDLDPTNDDPVNPDPAKIIVLQPPQTIAANTTSIPPINITIDLNQVPPLPDGAPYYIRATITDGTNPAVHSYAPGTISVVRLAADVVDLSQVGRSISGTTLLGFNPGANVGSTVRGVSDFDGDTVDDFVVVAQHGNPHNIGSVGEAYIVYGQDNVRFGGTLTVNAIGTKVSGATFEAPPIRNHPSGTADVLTSVVYGRGETDGITDVNFLPDLNGDLRPELIFGLSHVEGAWDTNDFDPSDQPPQSGIGVGCYPDFLVNNNSDTDTADPFDFQWYGGGMAVTVNSSNRDNDGALLVNGTAPRLESTSVSLEFVGQRFFGFFIGGDGKLPPGAAGDIGPRADDQFAANPGTDTPAEPNVIAGARFIGGGYDYVDAFGLAQPSREDSYGETVGSLGDINNDGVPEILISAPTNERYLQDLFDQFNEFGFVFSTHYQSTVYTGSITVLPGTNYFGPRLRDTGLGGTATTPRLDQSLSPPFGNCSANPPIPRHFQSPVDAFSVFAENIDDHLGGARDAGDFNQDGLDDIVCGAYLNDRTGAKDTGAVYVLYNRSVSGDFDLKKANDPSLRAPMLRIRGEKPGDQIGWRQAAGLDVNGDRIDDVFFSSPRTDFGGIARSTCGADFNQDGAVDQNDFSTAQFNSCVSGFGKEVFSNDPCKAFDYDNDGDIDADDRCVFCCLSGECEPDASCVHGLNKADCCESLVDNGFAAVVFGGRLIDGDRDISQIATPELPGAIFFGGHSGDRAGIDVSSAGDFNQDGFGDILIAAPGEIRVDSAGRQRLGVVYLIFGGTHLNNTRWNLSDSSRGVGSPDLPGIVFLSPFVIGRPNEAAPTTVGFLGDINHDGFGDIAIGNPKADFIDLTFPQGPDAPGSDPAAGRRSDAGNVYIVYGNNFGSNRGVRP